MDLCLRIIDEAIYYISIVEPRAVNENRFRYDNLDSKQLNILFSKRKYNEEL